MKASHSRLATWRRCRRKYMFGYGLGYVQPGGIGQLVGRVGHEVLAFWYINHRSRIADPAAIDLAKQRCDDLGIPPDDAARLLNALPRYFEYAREHDDFTVLAIEHEFTIDLEDEHQLHGIIDLVVEYPDGTRAVLEHKFNQQVTMTHLGLDPQPTIYMLGAEEFGVSHVVYNVVRVSTGKKAMEDPVVRQVVRRSPEYMYQFKQELSLQMHEVEAWHADPQRLAKAYANPMHDCSWSCGFFNACHAFAEGGDLTELSSMENRWEGTAREDTMTSRYHEDIQWLIDSAAELGFDVTQRKNTLIFTHPIGVTSRAHVSSNPKRATIKNNFYRMRRKLKDAQNV